MPLPTLAQLGGALALLVGIFLALPLAVALMTAGLLLLVLGTLAEMVVRGRRVAPPAGRSAPSARGVG